MEGWRDGRSEGRGAAGGGVGSAPPGPTGRQAERHRHPPPNASLPLPSTPIPSLGRSQPASFPSLPLGLSSLPSWARVWIWVWAPGRRHLAKGFEIV